MKGKVNTSQEHLAVSAAAMSSECLCNFNLLFVTIVSLPIIYLDVIRSTAFITSNKNSLKDNLL